MKLEIKNRVYKLTRNKAPLSCIIPSRSSKRSPLLYFDESQGINRALRYAVNQKSCFEDEQDGNVVVTPIIFEDGLLRVPKNNPVLQQFLHYHPLNGKKFEEVVVEKDAQKDLDVMTMQVDALVEAKSLSLEQMENIARVLFNTDIGKLSSAELKRDILVFAKNNPTVFLNAINDPELKLLSTVQKFFDNKVLSFRNKKRDVHYNLEGNKKRLVAIPFGENPIEFLASWFKSDDGLDVLDFLEKQI
jgi:hypothetical protein